MAHAAQYGLHIETKTTIGQFKKVWEEGGVMKIKFIEWLSLGLQSLSFELYSMVVSKQSYSLQILVLGEYLHLLKETYLMLQNKPMTGI